MNKGQDYRNTQKQRSEEAQKETIRLIDIGLTQIIKKVSVYKNRIERILSKLNDNDEKVNN